MICYPSHIREGGIRKYTCSYSLYQINVGRTNQRFILVKKLNTYRGRVVTGYYKEEGEWEWVNREKEEEHFLKCILFVYLRQESHSVTRLEYCQYLAILGPHHSYVALTGHSQVAVVFTDSLCTLQLTPVLVTLNYISNWRPGLSGLVSMGTCAVTFCIRNIYIVIVSLIKKEKSAGRSGSQL